MTTIHMHETTTATPEQFLDALDKTVKAIEARNNNLPQAAS